MRYNIEAWYKPDEILPNTEFHSDPMNTVQLLLAFEGEKYPCIGWYIASLNEWRRSGSPSPHTPIGWRPMPDMPDGLPAGTPKPLVVPDGYRLLTTGETIRKGDIYCRGAGHSWHENKLTGGKWNEQGYWTMARKQEPQEGASK